MRRVIIESPFAGADAVQRQANRDYAEAAMLDSLGRGEAPMLSHLLYTQVLNDDVPEQRQFGIDAGLAWGEVAHATVVYTDLGVSHGMAQGIGHAVGMGRPVEYRSLANWGDAE
jgi:hypothetical protein